MHPSMSHSNCPHPLNQTMMMNPTMTTATEERKEGNHSGNRHVSFAGNFVQHRSDRRPTMAPQGSCPTTRQGINHHGGMNSIGSRGFSNGHDSRSRNCNLSCSVLNANSGNHHRHGNSGNDAVIYNSINSTRDSTISKETEMKLKYPPMFGSLKKREAIENRTLIINNIPHEWDKVLFQEVFEEALKKEGLQYRERSVSNVYPSDSIVGQMKVVFLNAEMATRTLNTMDGYPIMDQWQLSIQRPPDYTGLTSGKVAFGFAKIEKDVRGRVTAKLNTIRTIRVSNVPSGIATCNLKQLILSACLQRRFTGLDPRDIITDISREDKHAFITFRTEEEAFVAAVELDNICLLGDYRTKIKRHGKDVPKLLAGHYKGPIPESITIRDSSTESKRQHPVPCPKKKNTSDADGMKSDVANSTQQCQAEIQQLKDELDKERKMNMTATDDLKSQFASCMQQHKKEVRQLKDELDKERNEKAAVEKRLDAVTKEREEKEKELGTKMEQLQTELLQERVEKAAVQKNLIVVKKERDEKDAEVAATIADNLKLRDDLAMANQAAREAQAKRLILQKHPLVAMPYPSDRLEPKAEDEMPIPDGVSSNTDASSSHELYPFSENEYQELKKRYLEPQPVQSHSELRGGRQRRKTTIYRAAIDFDTPSYKALKKKILQLEDSDSESKDKEIFVLLKQLALYEIQPSRGFPRFKCSDSDEEQDGCSDDSFEEEQEVFDVVDLTASDDPMEGKDVIDVDEME